MTVINNSRYFAGLFLILVLASCTSVKKFTANIKAPRATQNNLKSQVAENDAIEFLENIAVTPGKIYMKKSSGSAAFETVTVKKTPYDIMPTNLSDIEKANWLQLKYSIKMDVAVEEITNISLLQKIDEWWGTPYCLGGSSKNCVDCSFFTLDVMKQIYKVDLKRTAAQQYEQSAKIEWTELKEGDLIFFKTEGRRTISHVGIYLTNNKFAHASTSQGVTISDLADPYWQRRLYSLGRVAPLLNN
jgi:lipoprotein Spr